MFFSAHQRYFILLKYLFLCWPFILSSPPTIHQAGVYTGIGIVSLMESFIAQFGIIPKFFGFGDASDTENDVWLLESREVLVRNFLNSSRLPSATECEQWRTTDETVIHSFLLGVCRRSCLILPLNRRLNQCLPSWLSSFSGLCMPLLFRSKLLLHPWHANFLSSSAK